MSGVFLTLLSASSKTSAIVSAVGVGASALVGNVAGGSEQIIDVSGVSASAFVGNPSVSAFANVPVSGVSAIAGTSSVLIDTQSDALLQGVAASGSIGQSSISASALANTTGVSALGVIGDSTAGEGTNVLVTGTSSIGQVSSVVVSSTINAIVSGVSATGSLGTTNLSGTASVATTGVSASGAVGTAVAQLEGLPEGTILFFDRSSVATAIPTGFSLYTEENGQSITNFLIKGGSAVSRSTGSSAPVTSSVGSITSSSAGAHSPLSTSIGGFSGVAGAATASKYDSSSGSHTHTLTFSGSATYPASAEVQGMEIPLIRATATSIKVPGGAIVFSSDGTVFSGFSRKSWDVSNGVYKAASSVNASKPAPTNVAPSFSISVGTGGSHNHFTGTTLTDAGVGYPLNPQAFSSSQGGHTHTGNSFGQIGVWHQYKHLLPVVSASDQDVVAGMVVMYNGVSVPSGWLLCDGTNGTPDMVGYFIGYDNAKNTSGDLVGRDIIGSTGPTATTPAPSPTTYATSSVPITIGTATNPHNHTAPNVVRGVTNQKHGLQNNPHTHPASSTTFTMPTAYTPQTLTLIFIQKAAA